MEIAKGIYIINFRCPLDKAYDVNINPDQTHHVSDVKEYYL